MGSWNGTCGISNLPIEASDDILLFVLAESRERARNKSGGGFSYPTGLYTPVGLPIHGKYDDYGGIQDVTANGDIMFDFLTSDRRFSLTIDSAAGVVPTTIEELINDVIERGHADYKLMLVRKDILDDMKANPATEYAEFDGQFPVFVEGYKQEIEIVKAERGDDFNEMLHAQFAEMELPERIGWDNVYLRLLESHDIPSLKVFVRKAMANPEAGIQDSIVDVVYVSRLLGDLRKFWTPQSGTGSQATNHDVHLALSASVTAVCTERDRKWAEEYGE